MSALTGFLESFTKRSGELREEATRAKQAEEQGLFQVLTALTGRTDVDPRIREQALSALLEVGSGRGKLTRRDLGGYFGATEPAPVVSQLRQAIEGFEAQGGDPRGAGPQVLGARAATPQAVGGGGLGPVGLPAGAGPRAAVGAPPPRAETWAAPGTAHEPIPGLGAAGLDAPGLPAGQPPAMGAGTPAMGAPMPAMGSAGVGAASPGASAMPRRSGVFLDPITQMQDALRGELDLITQLSRQYGMTPQEVKRVVATKLAGGGTLPVEREPRWREVNWRAPGDDTIRTGFLRDDQPGLIDEDRQPVRGPYEVVPPGVYSAEVRGSGRAPVVRIERQSDGSERYVGYDPMTGERLWVGGTPRPATPPPSYGAGGYVGPDAGVYAVPREGEAPRRIGTSGTASTPDRRRAQQAINRYNQLLQSNMLYKLIGGSEDEEGRQIEARAFEQMRKELGYPPTMTYELLSQIAAGQVNERGERLEAVEGAGAGSRAGQPPPKGGAAGAPAFDVGEIRRRLLERRSTPPR